MNKAIEVVEEMIAELIESCPKFSAEHEEYTRIQDKIEVLHEVIARLKLVE